MTQTLNPYKVLLLIVRLATPAFITLTAHKTALAVCLTMHKTTMTKTENNKVIAAEMAPVLTIKTALRTIPARG